MTTPTNVEFVDQTTIISEAWLDGINDWVNGAYSVLGETFTPAAFRTAIGASAPADIQAQTATAFTTGGTSTAFTLTPSPAITSLIAGQRFRVKFNATAGAAPTLAISGLAATALKLYDSTGAKVAASSTSIIANMLTDVEYDGTDMVILDSLPSGSLGYGQTWQDVIRNAGTTYYTDAKPIQLRCYMTTGATGADIVLIIGGISLGAISSLGSQAALLADIIIPPYTSYSYTSTTGSLGFKELR